MKKHAYGIMAVLAVMLMAFIGTASATTYNAPKGSEIVASVSGDRATVSCNMPDVAYLEQYRVTNADGRGWNIRHSMTSGSATFDPYTGDRFQLVNKKGEFLSLSPELAVSNYSPLVLKGVDVECSNPKGCALQLR